MKRCARLILLTLGLSACGGITPRPSAGVDDHQLRDVESGLQISMAAAPARVSPNAPLNVTATLTNVSDEPLTLLSHVDTHETHLDWYRFRLEARAPDEKGRCDPAHARREVRQLAITDARDRSIPVAETLAPGERIAHTVDLQAWARRRVNGGSPIAPGLYLVSVVYSVSWKDWELAGPVWRGAVESPRMPVEVTGRLTTDRCGAVP